MVLFAGLMLVLGLEAQATGCSYDEAYAVGFADGRAVEAVGDTSCLPHQESAYQAGFVAGLFTTTVGAPSYDWRMSWGYLTNLDGVWDDGYPKEF